MEEDAIKGGVHVCTHLGGVIRGGYPGTEQEGGPLYPGQVHALLHTPVSFLWRRTKIPTACRSIVALVFTKREFARNNACKH